MSAKCGRLKKDGSPCLVTCMKNSDVCYFHGTNIERKESVKKQDEAFDMETELKHELKRVQRASGNRLEKAKLVLEIIKMLSNLEKKTGDNKPEDLGRELTPAEKVNALRKKDDV